MQVNFIDYYIMIIVQETNQLSWDLQKWDSRIIKRDP